MKKFSFMIAFIVWMIVFEASIRNLKPEEDYAVLFLCCSVIFATIWGVVVFFGIKELTAKWK